jgi:hypothetical protein
MNLVDRILKSTISRVVTKDEWHTLVVGFADGLSFSMEGKHMRRGLAKPGIDVENIDKEKVWYYKAPYVTGELLKVAIAVHFL